MPDRSDLDAVRDLLARLIAEGQGDEAVALVIRLLSELRDENVSLQHRLREALRRLYGRSSEKLNAKDQALLARVLGDDATPSPPAGSEGAKTPPEKGAKGAKKPLPEGAAHGRGERPTKLPTTVTQKPVPEGERVCPQCGGAMHDFGHVDAWQVEYVPGHFELRVTEREQLSCRRCRDVVVTAPAPPKVIESAVPGPGLLAKILVDKGEDHLPIERQQRRLEREGFTVPVTTLAGWWTQAADLLRPLHAELEREAMRAWLPQVDATGLDVLDRDHPKGIRQGHLWTAVGGRAVVFVFTPAKSKGLGELLELRTAVTSDDAPEHAAPREVDEGAAASETTPSEARHDEHELRDEDRDEGASKPAEGPALRVGGPVQCDGEGLFTSVQTKAGLLLVLVHCWMHARRYFERAVKAKDLRANVAMRLIEQMYEVERKATEEKVSPEERARRRQTQTWPLLERLREWVQEIRAGVPPSTPLGKALKYVERRWLSLCVFVLDGRIPIDNGEVERQIRRIAVGRNNWLFTGGDEAGRRLATVASLCATCRKLGIDPWEYLRDALLAAGSGMSPRELVASFTPWAWAEKKAENARAERAAVGA